MKFLIIGLGSMGKRRIRCLQSLGFKEIGGLDSRNDRCLEAVEKYGVSIYASITEALASFEPTALIISTPPDFHSEYMNLALEKNLHFFVEASVLDFGMNELRQNLLCSKIIAAPSATLLFHPAINHIQEILRSGKLGKLSNLLYHSGQFLPDWHPYETVSDYYVSNPSTGGGREIVPFEMTWFTSIFGFPNRVCSNYRKTITIKGADRIDDTYNLCLDYGNFLSVVTIDVVSRHATRRLLINGDRGQLIWDWDESFIKIFDGITKEWEHIPYIIGDSEPGYNSNIGENMYIDEIHNFIEAIEGSRPFINNMDHDHRVLKLLYAFEEADRGSKYVEFIK